MKILILGDLHYGMKSYDYIVDKKLNLVFEKYIFPYIKEHNIKYIFQLGDVFDDKRGVYSESGYNYVRYFLLPIIKNDLCLYQILGNHDIFYDQNNKINSLKMFFELINLPNLNLIYYFKDIVLNGKKIYLISYGSQINLTNIYGDILFGHFAIEGFEMQKNVPVMNGMDKSVFSNFEMVITGHIHRRDKQKNIFNVGSLIECNFGESDFIHGFHVLNTEDMNMEFIPIEKKIFVKVNSDDIDKYKNFNNVVVELNLDDTQSEVEKENVFSAIKKLNPVDVKIKYINKKKEIKNDIEIEEYDFLNILKEYINSDDSGMDKEILLKMIMKFYSELGCYLKENIMKFGKIFKEKNCNEINLNNPDHKGILKWVRDFIIAYHNKNRKLANDIKKNIDREIKRLNLNRDEVYFYYGDIDDSNNRKKILNMFDIMDY